MMIESLCYVYQGKGFIMDHFLLPLFLLLVQSLNVVYLSNFLLFLFLLLSLAFPPSTLPYFPLKPFR